MAEVINTKVFDVEKKFVDFAGLDYFWEKAKAYVDGADKVTADKVTALETTVNGTANAEGVLENGLVQKVAALRAEVNALGGAEGGISGMIDAAINALDVTDAAVDNQYVSSVSQADGKITVSRVALPDWTGAINTAADQALTDAKTYTNETVGTWTAGETAGTGLRKEIEEKVAAVAADAKSYSVVAVTGDELSALGANVKEAYKLVDEDGAKAGEVIKIYKDSALQSVVLDGQELVFTYLLATGAKDVVRVDVSNFLAESEFKDGLQVVDHVVSVKVDAASESFLTVGADGIKLSGVQTAIDAAEAAAKAAAKTYADGLKTEIEGVIAENERVTAESLTDLDTRVKSIEDQDTYVESEVNAAIADAKKAGTDAADALDAYKPVIEKSVEDAQAAAIAQAAEDAANMLENYYKKSEVDSAIATAKSGAETTAKNYTDTAVGVYASEGVEASGLRKEIAERDAQVLSDAKAYTDSKVDGKFDAAGAADDALAAAKKYTDDEIAAAVGVYASEGVEASGLRKEIADNSAADQAYAKAYTDELFDSFQFATNSDIDTLFAPKAE